MSHEPDIFGYLATTKISGITTALLDDSTKNSYAAKKNLPFWKGPISIWATVRASRTYPGALPIPEGGGIVQVSVEPGAVTTLQPPGTEIWEILGIIGTGQGGTATGSLGWFDGTSTVNIDQGQSFTTSGHSQFLYATIPPITAYSGKLRLTNSLYWAFQETGGAFAVIFSVAYHKVSL